MNKGSDTFQKGMFPLPIGLKTSRSLINKLENVFKTHEENAIARDLPPIPTPEMTQQFLLKSALLLVDNGEYKMARQILGEILKRDSFNVEAIRWMGWCFKKEGQTDIALKCYEKLNQYAKTDENLFELGELHYDLRQDEKAKEIWTEALSYCQQESPRLFDLHKNLGNVFMRLGDLDSAEENYNKAHTLRPHSDALHVNMGSLWYFRVDLRKAFEHFKMAVDINPYNDRAWCGVALVARDKKDKVWAKEMILKSLDINPVNLVALQQLVSWALEDKEYKNAIERVMLYTFEVQNDVSMMYTLAGLLFQSGQVLEAELELERILTLDPLHESALQLLDLIHGKEVQK